MATKPKRPMAAGLRRSLKLKAAKREAAALAARRRRKALPRPRPKMQVSIDPTFVAALTPPTAFAPPARNTHWSDILRRHDACNEAIEFADRFATFAEAWMACINISWMAWWLFRSTAPDAVVLYNEDARIYCAFTDCVRDHHDPSIHIERDAFLAKVKDPNFVALVTSPLTPVLDQDAAEDRYYEYCKQLKTEREARERNTQPQGESDGERQRRTSDGGESTVGGGSAGPIARGSANGGDRGDDTPRPGYPVAGCDCDGCQEVRRRQARAAAQAALDAAAREQSQAGGDGAQVASPAAQGGSGVEEST